MQFQEAALDARPDVSDEAHCPCRDARLPYSPQLERGANRCSLRTGARGRRAGRVFFLFILNQ